jgi:NAD(P)-dependent dehydrogenase (short-subunit alcohol dehydrogenase family)
MQNNLFRQYINMKLVGGNNMQSSRRLEGRSAIVTGGGRGIGRAVALAYAREGANIAVTARSPEEINKVAEEIRALGQDALAIQANVSSEADTNRAVQAVLERWGRVDILFNAAGVRSIHPSQELTLAQWQEVVDTNLTGSFLFSQRVFPAMQAAGYGKIIMVGSIMSHAGAPFRAAYVATKTGLVGLTQALGVEWAHYGINVNILSPGYFATDAVLRQVEIGQLNLSAIERRTPIGRIGRMEDLVGPAVFLASPDSDFMCGQSLIIDGGWLAFGFMQKDE